ncbi:nucleoside hydrolase [Pelagibius marinus]|uniref:nucleoside hydrolase n=1 Tax=Pelagibius marinus TaxID=2762760 RepID=UPI00187253FA|nr:nucleoside hydrolase [Pelagibius marinus]
MVSSPRPIIIDTDPGQDDAIAILLALASDEFEVLGITVVAGNVPLALTEQNARKVCELAGRPEVKVFAGCSRPLVRPQVTAEAWHGKTGLDGPDLPAPTMPLQKQHAVDWIVDTLRAAPAGSITLCTLGPLTNIATALIKAPDIAPRIAEIVMMGGGFFEGGNITPAAEFNIYVDPHAAHVAFTSGVKLTMHPIDVTHKALMSKAWIDSLRALGTRTGAAAAAMLDFYERFDMKKYGSEGGPLHDPCVLAYLLRPELFGGKDCSVQIETGSELTMGMTVVDWWNVTPMPPNCRVINQIDAAGFYTLIGERLARLP